MVGQHQLQAWPPALQALGNEMLPLMSYPTCKCPDLLSPQPSDFRALQSQASHQPLLTEGEGVDIALGSYDSLNPFATSNRLVVTGQPPRRRRQPHQDSRLP